MRRDGDQAVAPDGLGRGPRPLRRDGGPALWRQLLADLRRRMESDEFAASFPGELALMRDYGVSRHTVRQSLQVLRDEGVVVAGRGRTPRVAGPADIAQRLGSVYSLFEAVEAAGMTQHSLVRVLDVRADGVVAARLDLEESTPLVYLERIRFAGADPLAIDRAWLPEPLAAPLLDVDFTHTALYAEYATRCAVTMTGGREHIRAVAPTRAERRLLETGEEVAAFAIERLGLSHDRPVEWRHTLVRGDRFSLTSDLAAREGHHLGLAPGTGNAPR